MGKKKACKTVIPVNDVSPITNVYLTNKTNLPHFRKAVKKFARSKPFFSWQTQKSRRKSAKNTTNIYPILLILILVLP